MHRKYVVDEAGNVLANMRPAGEPLLGAAALLLPSPEETRTSLLRIRRAFKISRAQLAVCLAIPKDTLRRWETGERFPSAAARRLVQLLQGILFSEQASISGLGELVIGRIDMEAVERSRRELLPVSAHAFVNRFHRKQAKQRPLDPQVPAL